jgi:hypothetical protein
MAPLFNPDSGPARMTAICELTLLCSQGDTHPSDSGYRAMAERIFEATGYTLLAGLTAAPTGAPRRSSAARS